MHIKNAINTTAINTFIGLSYIVGYQTLILGK
jgi:hypothetical protein